MHNKSKIIAFIIILLVASGCSTLKESTLPANFEPVFDFPAYSVTPIANQDWRFWYKDTKLQRLSFYNIKKYCYLFFEIIPVFSGSINEKNIISHFQEKTLNNLKLSPDAELSEQKTEKNELNFEQKLYKILKLSYALNKERYELSVHYYLNSDTNILYVFSLLKELRKGEDKAVIFGINKDFNEFLKQVVFKNPDPKEMTEFRINYAISDFIDSTQDKYRKDKFLEVQEKYKAAYNEVNSWISDLDNSYKAHNLLGLLHMFNDKFERCGEGFDANKAKRNLDKSVSLRKNYKEAHMNLADLFEHQDKTNAAINEYLFVVRISPTDENIYYRLGKLYEKKGEKERAKEFYKKAVRFWGGAAATLQELEIKIKQMN